jgi:hydrogenase/urease accessory protein HupE
MNRAVTALLPLLLVIATPAHAHTGTGIVHGFTAGFLHPLLGLDHLLAMVTVGLWAGCVGGRALWAWPLAFVTVMLLGALVGLGGWAMPQAEILIGLTVVALGLAGRDAAAALGRSRRRNLRPLRPRPRLRPRRRAAGRRRCRRLHGRLHPCDRTPPRAGLALGLALSRLDRIWLPGLSGGAVAATGLVLLLG